jgi:hypothetical protein
MRCVRSLQLEAIKRDFGAMKRENQRLLAEIKRLRGVLPASRLCHPHGSCGRTGLGSLQTRLGSQGSLLLIEDYEADISALKNEVATLETEVWWPMEA